MQRDDVLGVHEWTVLTREPCDLAVLENSAYVIKAAQAQAELLQRKVSRVPCQCSP